MRFNCRFDLRCTGGSSLTINEHLLIYVLAVSMSSLANIYSSSLPIFKLGYWVSKINSFVYGC